MAGSKATLSIHIAADGKKAQQEIRATSSVFLAESKRMQTGAITTLRAIETQAGKTRGALLALGRTHYGVGRLDTSLLQRDAKGAVADVQRYFRAIERDTIKAPKIAGLDAREQEVKRSAERMRRELHSVYNQRAERLGNIGNAMTAAGGVMSAGTVALAAGGAYAFNTARSFETAFSDVRKNVNATEKELQDMQRDFEQMSLKVSSTFQEIAGVASDAGQLGIAKRAIKGFTQISLEMGEATNMAAREASVGLAKLSNVTGMQQTEGNFRKLGSTIVALGKDGATTESQILDMGLRIAGAGKTVGMSQAEILGYASAVGSLGIEAEAGGSAVSTMINRIALAVSKGGKSLEQFANVAGMSSEQFRDAFRANAANAMNAFLAGLGRLQKGGKDVLPILEAMGVREVRLRATVLGLANANDVLTKSLATGRKGWEDGSALADEYAERLKTADAQLQLLQNEISLTVKEFGVSLIPAFRDAAEASKPLLAMARATANAFAALPRPVQTVVMGMIAFGASLGPIVYVGGNVVKILATMTRGFGALQATRGGATLAQIAIESRAAGGSLGGVTAALRALGPASTSAFAAVATGAAAFALVATAATAATVAIKADIDAMNEALELQRKVRQEEKERPPAGKMIDDRARLREAKSELVRFLQTPNAAASGNLLATAVEFGVMGRGSRGNLSRPAGQRLLNELDRRLRQIEKDLPDAMKERQNFNRDGYESLKFRSGVDLSRLTIMGRQRLEDLDSAFANMKQSGVVTYGKGSDVAISAGNAQNMGQIVEALRAGGVDARFDAKAGVIRVNLKGNSFTGGAGGAAFNPGLYTGDDKKAKAEADRRAREGRESVAERARADAEEAKARLDKWSKFYQASAAPLPPEKRKALEDRITRLIDDYISLTAQAINAEANIDPKNTSAGVEAQRKLSGLNRERAGLIESFGETRADVQKKIEEARQRYAEQGLELEKHRLQVQGETLTAEVAALEFSLEDTADLEERRAIRQQILEKMREQAANREAQDTQAADDALPKGRKPTDRELQLNAEQRQAAADRRRQAEESAQRQADRANRADEREEKRRQAEELRAQAENAHTPQARRDKIAQAQELETAAALPHEVGPLQERHKGEMSDLDRAIQRDEGMALLLDMARGQAGPKAYAKYRDTMDSRREGLPPEQVLDDMRAEIEQLLSAASMSRGLFPGKAPFGRDQVMDRLGTMNASVEDLLGRDPQAMREWFGGQARMLAGWAGEDMGSAAKVGGLPALTEATKSAEAALDAAGKAGPEEKAAVAAELMRNLLEASQQAAQMGNDIPLDKALEFGRVLLDTFTKAGAIGREAMVGMLYELEDGDAATQRLRDTLKDINEATRQAAGHWSKAEEVVSRLGVRWDRLTESQRELVRQIIRANEELDKTERLRSMIEDVSQGMEGVFRDSFDAILSGQESFGKRFLASFKRMIADMAAEAAAGESARFIRRGLEGLTRIGRRGGEGEQIDGGETLGGGSTGNGVADVVGMAAGLLKTIEGARRRGEGAGAAAEGGSVPLGGNGFMPGNLPGVGTGKPVPVVIVGMSPQATGGFGGVLQMLLGGGGKIGRKGGPGFLTAAGTIASLIPGGQAVGGIIGAVDSLFGGLFADGGTLQAGRWGIVGERGPELAYSGPGGTRIVPMAAMPSAPSYRMPAVAPAGGGALAGGGSAAHLDSIVERVAKKLIEHGGFSRVNTFHVDTINDRADADYIARRSADEYGKELNSW